MRRLSLFLILLAVAGCDGGGPEADVVTGREAGVTTGAGTAVTLYSLQAVAEGEAAILSVDAADTDDWDVGFRGTEILLNGGSSGSGSAIGVIRDVPFDAVDEALRDDLSYRRDGDSPCPSGPFRAVCTASGDGWFRIENGVVTPIPGRTLLLRLANGRGYAKVAIDGYVGDANGGVIAFRYAVNPVGSSFATD